MVRRSPHPAPGEAGCQTPNLGRHANMCGLPQLAKVPVEIVEIIYNHSASASFWRFTAALEFRRRLREVVQTEQSTTRVRNIVAWERGDNFKTSNDEDGDSNASEWPVIRPTLDSQGIEKIERLVQELAHHPSNRVDNKLFAVVDSGWLNQVTLSFQVRIRISIFCLARRCLTSSSMDD